MSNSSGHNYSWPIAVICFVTWIGILSFALSFVFGAVLSSGWIIAGTIFSIAAFCGLLVIREITETILSFRVFAEKKATAIRIPVRATPQVVNAGGSEIRMDAWSRRDILGLRSHEISRNNRRRSAKRRSSVSSAGIAASGFGNQANQFPRQA